MHQRCAQRQPLPPAAGQIAGQLFLASLQMQKFDDLAHPIGPFAARHIVHARIKLHIFAHGQFIIQRELLRHVADLRPNLLSLSANILAQD
jgi:hypothetical protein